MTFEDFLPYILPSAKGCPTEVAVFNARLAAIEFCRKSLIWRAQQSPIAAVADQTEYAYKMAVDTAMSQLMQVTVAGSPLSVVPPSVGKSMLALQSQREFAFGSIGRFTINPSVEADAEIVTYGAVEPTIDAEDIDDEFQRYAEEIGRGALYRLCLRKHTDYYDPSLAREMKDRFEDDINDARSNAVIGLAQTAIRVTPQWM